MAEVGGATFAVILLSTMFHKHCVYAESNDIQKDHPFRMSKMNILWQKAKQKLPMAKLPEAFKDFKMQDKFEMSAKRKVADGYDSDGSYRSLVRQKLLALISKYKLDHGEDMKRDGGDISMNIKMDSKIGKLLKKAKYAGFSHDEMQNLEAEMEHHKQKLKEFNILKKEVDKMSKSAMNSIDRFHDGDRKTPSQEKLKKKQNELRQKHKELRSGMEELEQMVGVGDDSLTFSEPRVLELWHLALKANFTDVELRSLKEELLHFEQKIKKHDYIKNEEEQLVEPRDEKENTNSEGVRQSNLLQEHAYRVKKIHHALKSRILSRTEL